jgi:hypothetical protein
MQVPLVIGSTGCQRSRDLAEQVVQPCRDATREHGHVEGRQCACLRAVAVDHRVGAGGVQAFAALTHGPRHQRAAQLPAGGKSTSGLPAEHGQPAARRESHVPARLHWQRIAGGFGCAVAAAEVEEVRNTAVRDGAQPAPIACALDAN